MSAQHRCSRRRARTPNLLLPASSPPQPAGRRRFEMQKLPILAALTALALGQPALAQDAPPTRTAVVDHRDLDLSTDKGAESEERRVGKGGVSTCKFRGAPDH